MKKFYLIGSLIFSVIILIVGFQNFSSSFDSFTVFFFDATSNGTVTVFGIAMLGIFTGAFYYGFITSLLRERQEDEESPGGMV